MARVSSTLLLALAMCVISCCAARNEGSRSNRIRFERRHPQRHDPPQPSCGGGGGGGSTGDSGGGSTGGSGGNTGGSGGGGGSTGGSGAGAGTGTVLKNVFITWYGFDDNDDGNPDNTNTATISNPVMHQVATEDLGTFDRPITAAGDQRFRLLKPGDKFYVPSVRKYFILEDTCRECTTDTTNGVQHVDLFMGSSTQSGGRALIACEEALTLDSGAIVLNPANNLPVVAQRIFANGVCTNQFFP